MLKEKMNKTGLSCAQGQFTETIKKKAQEIYEKSGRKQGRDLENWLEAERIVKAKMCSKT
jgi:hypothetical protein